MDSLIELIKQEVEKSIKKTTMLSSIPCYVTDVIGDEKYKVKSISTGDVYELPNFSGSPLGVGENVKVYYQGGSVSSRSAYIGASLTKANSVGEDIVYLTGISNPARFQSNEKVYAYIILEATRDTTVTFSFNANIEGEGGDYLFRFFVDNVVYDYYVKGSVSVGNYDNCQVVLPISLTKGERTIAVKGIGSGNVENMLIFVSGQGIKEHEIKVRELTGTSPLSFMSNGDDLLDWRIRGAIGGVGNRGINYLKQTESSMPDGTYGKQVNAVYSDSTARTGTFNSGTATNISFRFNANDSPITPQDIGKIVLSDGENETELEIFSGHIGSLWIGEDGGYPLTVQCGDDGTGRIVVYASGDLPALGKWCYTKKVDITPNTDYTFERIGGIENVKIQYITSKEVGHVNTAWSAPLKSIPGNQTPDKNVEQWTTMSSSRRYWETDTVYTYLDSRPATYEFCSYYADLQPGHYKVIAEGYGKNWGYTYMRNPDMSRDQTPYMALIAEDNTEIIPRRMIFQDTSSPFHHEEYEFTISEPTKVGLYFKAINLARYDYGNYTRFMIVDYDVVAEPFTVDISGGETLSGVTCWEYYHHTIPITLSCGDETTTINYTTIDSLGQDEYIDMLNTGIDIPTYAGANIIEVETDVKPSVYIKYKG